MTESTEASPYTKTTVSPSPAPAGWSPSQKGMSPVYIKHEKMVPSDTYMELHNLYRPRESTQQDTAQRSRKQTDAKPGNSTSSEFLNPIQIESSMRAAASKHARMAESSDTKYRLLAERYEQACQAQMKASAEAKRWKTDHDKLRQVT